MLFVGQVSGLVENFNIGIFSDTMNVIKVNLFLMVPHLEIYLFVTLSVTLTLFHSIKLKLWRIVKYIKQVTTYDFRTYSKEIIDIFPDFTIASLLAFSWTLFKWGFLNCAWL